MKKKEMKKKKTPPNPRFEIIIDKTRFIISL